MLKTIDMAEASAKSEKTGYQEDFYLWTQEQARLLRERRFAELDLENLIEEVESVGRSEKKEIRNRLRVLLAHLLKWKYQPDARKPGWTGTIVHQRQALREILADNPSLHRRPAEIFEEAYRAARLVATKETGIAYALFPDVPPFTLDEALSADFLPREPELGEGDRALP